MTRKELAATEQIRKFRKNIAQAFEPLIDPRAKAVWKTADFAIGSCFLANCPISSIGTLEYLKTAISLGDRFAYSIDADQYRAMSMSYRSAVDAVQDLLS